MSSSYSWLLFADGNRWRFDALICQRVFNQLVDYFMSLKLRSPNQLSQLVRDVPLCHLPHFIIECCPFKSLISYDQMEPSFFLGGHKELESPRNLGPHNDNPYVVPKKILNHGLTRENVARHARVLQIFHQDDHEEASRGFHVWSWHLLRRVDKPSKVLTRQLCK